MKQITHKPQITILFVPFHFLPALLYPFLAFYAYFNQYILRTTLSDSLDVETTNTPSAPFPRSISISTPDVLSFGSAQVRFFL